MSRSTCSFLSYQLTSRLAELAQSAESENPAGESFPSTYCLVPIAWSLALQSLIEVGNDVANIFNTHRKPHHPRSYSGRRLLFNRKLLMRCRGRVNHQRLGIADI